MMIAYIEGKKSSKPTGTSVKKKTQKTAPFC